MSVYMPCVKLVKRGDKIVCCGEPMVIRDDKAHCAKHGIANKNGCGSMQCVDAETLEVRCKKTSCEWTLAKF